MEFCTRCRCLQVDYFVQRSERQLPWVSMTASGTAQCQQRVDLRPSLSGQLETYGGYAEIVPKAVICPTPVQTVT